MFIFMNGYIFHEFDNMFSAEDFNFIWMKHYVHKTYVWLIFSIVIYIYIYIYIVWMGRTFDIFNWDIGNKTKCFERD